MRVLIWWRDGPRWSLAHHARYPLGTVLNRTLCGLPLPDTIETDVPADLPRCVRCRSLWAVRAAEKAAHALQVAEARTLAAWEKQMES